MVEATSVLQSIRIEEVDASAVTTGVDEAIAAANQPATVEADASTIASSIDEAVASATPPPVPVDVDTESLGGAIDEAVAAATPAPIEVPVDAEEITGEIDAALSGVDTSGLQGELDSTAGSASKLAGASTEAGVGIGSIAPAAAIATGETGALSDVISQVSPAMVGATAATVGVVEAGKKLFDAALQQNTALARLQQTYGALADSVEHVNFGGINEDLDKLAVRTGANVDGLRNFAASFGVLGKSAGDSTGHVADVSQQIILLAERASVLNPNLGTADSIVQRLSTSLSRGGRFLSAYGIALSTAQINAEALKETGKSTAAELSIYDKIVAGATLSTQQLGGALGSDINQGAQKAEVQLRSLKAAFEETLKGAGAPLIQPVIDALTALEPVLASVARVFGQVLGGALHLVVPLLELFALALAPVADLMAAIPSPVFTAVAAFVLLQKALDTQIVLNFIGAALGLGPALSGMGAEAGVAAAATEGLGVATAETGGIMASLETGLAAINPLFLGAALLVGGLAVAMNANKDAAARQKEAVDGATKAVGDYSHTLLENVTAAEEFNAKNADVIDGVNFAKRAFLGIHAGLGDLSSNLTAAGVTMQQFNEALAGNEGTAIAFEQDLKKVADAGGSAGSAADKLRGQFANLQEIYTQGAHAALILAVSHNTLSRAEEVAAISAHTAKDGHVDWIGVLNQLQPILQKNSTQTDSYGNALDKTTTAAKHAADSTQNLAAIGLGTLTQTGQLSQAQADAAIALHTSATGAVDYAGALKDIDPAAAKVAEDVAIISGGLDTQHTRFLLAKDEAALYKEQFDEMVAPFLNAQQAQSDFTAKVDAATSSYSNASVAAKAYKDNITEIVDPTLSVNEANIKLQEALEKTNQSLATNKGVVDERTKAGRDDEQAVIDLVRAYDSEIEAMIRSGESSQTVATERQDEIAKLEDLKAHYPGLTQSVDEYVQKLQTANTSGQEAARITEAHRASLEDVVTSGEKWIETLIATGANEGDVATARQQEIDKLNGLKAQYPELSPVIDSYVQKLQSIPPDKLTEVGIENLENTLVQTDQVNEAIKALHGADLPVTVNNVDAIIKSNSTQGTIDALKGRENDRSIVIAANGDPALASAKSTQDAIDILKGTDPPLPITADNIIAIQRAQDTQAAVNALQGHEIVITANVDQATQQLQILADAIHVPLAEAERFRIFMQTGVFPAAMSGGDFGAWQSVLVGEQGPEVVTFPQNFTVHPHGHDPAPQGKLFENLIVQEVAQDPMATATAVSRELGRVAKR